MNKIDFRQIIRDEAKLRNIKVSWLCRIAGVPKDGVVRYLKHPEVSLHSEIIVKLLEFCDYEIVKKSINLEQGA